MLICMPSSGLLALLTRDRKVATAAPYLWTPLLPQTGSVRTALALANALQLLLSRPALGSWREAMRFPSAGSRPITESSAMRRPTSTRRPQPGVRANGDRPAWSQTSTGGKPAYPTCREWPPRPGPELPLGGWQIALETPDEGIGPPLEGGLDAGSSEERQSPLPAGIISSFPAMRRLART